jgi:hypothetical protein
MFSSCQEEDWRVLQPTFEQYRVALHRQQSFIDMGISTSNLSQVAHFCSGTSVGPVLGVIFGSV